MTIILSYFSSFCILFSFISSYVAGRELSSLAFVIDDTSSMWNDIYEVKRDTYAIFETVLNHNGSQIDNFLLLTFNDIGPNNDYRCTNPGVKERANTRDHDAFKTALSNIVPGGGAPGCEECPMAGIKRAIEMSRPKSSIYVFTDATAKDFYMFEEVKKAAQDKECQIVFALTGQCGEPETSDRYKVYLDTAEATGGRVFNVNKGEVNKVLNYVKKTITGRRTTPVEKKLKPGVHAIPFNADSLMGEVILSFTSNVPNDPSVMINAPDGSVVPKETVFYSAKAQVYSFNVTKSGPHVLKVDTATDTRAEVSAVSGVEFKHGFSAIKLPSIVDTSTRPSPGAKSHLSIKLDEGEIALKSVQILDLDGNVMLKLPLQISDNETKFYTTEAFDPPNKSFRIAIIGCTAENECNITRTAPAPVEVAKILPGETENKAPSITELEAKINVNYSEPLQVTCKVNGYPKPDITWKNMNTGETFVNVTLPGTTFPYDHVNILYIENTTENVTYSCEAKNTIASDIKQVTVEVAPKRYLNFTDTPKNVTVEYEKEGIISCSVDAYPPADITWYKDGIKVTPSDNVKIQESHHYSVVTIKNSTLIDEGKYSCEAKNEDTVQLVDMHFTITGLEPPEIIKHVTDVSVLKGSSTTIECKILKGKPRPLIRWYLGTPSTIEKWNNQEQIVINNADKADSGIYQCQAENRVGKDQHGISLLVEYGPIIVKTDEKKELITIVTGSEISISCDVDGVPPPAVTWLKKNVAITNSTKIHILDNHTISFIADPSSAGNYKCTATNKHGSDDKNVEVYVTVPASISPVAISRLNKSLSVGARSTLVCSAKGKPEPDITWTFQNFHASDPLIKGNTKFLRLENIQTTDEGNYTCIANNSAGADNITYSVHVVEAPEIENSPKITLSVERGKSIELKCKILKGIPKPSITWSFQLSKGDKDSPERFHEFIEWKNKESITVEKATTKNSGTYECKAENHVSTDYLDTILQVEYPPQILDKEKEKGFINAKVNSKVIIPCNVDGSPAPDVTWFKDGVEIVNDGKPYTIGIQVLKFSAELSVIGNYTCQAKNKLGSDAKSVKVDVIDPPSIIDTPSNKTIAVAVGQNWNLKCTAKGIPEPSIKWTYKSFGASEPSTETLIASKDNSVQLKHIQVKQAGYYTCLALNKGGSKNVTYEIQVFAPPAIVKTYKESSFVAVEGDLALQIDCKATAEPIPTITWTNVNTSLALGSTYHVENGTLFITNVPEEAGGLYTCEAQNGGGTDLVTYEVIVQKYPPRGPPVSTIYVKRGDSADIECPVTHDDTDLLRWYKNENLMHKGELLIRSATLKESGSYTCRVSSVKRSLSKTVEVIVGYEPKFKTAEDENVNMYEGLPVSLNCETYARPEAHVTWSHNGKELSLTNATYYSPEGLTSPGEYKCEASNRFGNISRNFNATQQYCVIEKSVLVKKNKNIPLMLNSRTLKWLVSEKSKDIKNIAIPKGKHSVIMFCPSGFKDKFAKLQTVSAFCDGGANFLIKGKKYDYSEIQCKDEIHHKVLRTGKECMPDSEVIIIGYNATKDVETPVYEVCFDNTNQIPMYTKHVMQNSFANDKFHVAVWSDGDDFPIEFEDAYDCDTQIKTIMSFLNKKFHNIDKCCFYKRQLVSPIDVFPGAPQKSTFSYLNVVPHWNSCNKKNWNEIEDRVRKLSKTLNKDLVIWTGTAKQLVINIGRDRKPVYISEAEQPVPLYLWKVIQNPVAKTSIAVIQVNVPDLKVKDASSRKYRLCADQCARSRWMYFPGWRDEGAGYVYCCTLKDFEHAFGYEGTFEPDMEDLLISE